VIKREEESFLATIDGGLERIEKLFTAIERSGAGLVGGASIRRKVTCTFKRSTGSAGTMERVTSAECAPMETAGDP
jgi:hypothetical protein